ncbi:MAG: hypothetical protein K2Z81_24490 [Cyanobacteria bacterium]|nr:hypothetical protein [Cyanobacteriota bacterium]
MPGNLKDSDSSSGKKEEGSQSGAKKSYWAVIRKLETIMFLAMFLLVPLFAYRVVDYTQGQLLVVNLSKELVLDLHRAKDMATSKKESVELSGSTLKGTRLYSYVISYGSQVHEVIILPEGLSVVGTVTFTESGAPKDPSSFILSGASRSSTIEIDKAGIISVP